MYKAVLVTLMLLIAACASDKDHRSEEYYKPERKLIAPKLECKHTGSRIRRTGSRIKYATRTSPCDVVQGDQNVRDFQRDYNRANNQQRHY